MNWFKEELTKLKTDPQFIAEKKLLDLTEAICRIKQPSGIYKLLFIVMEKIAGMLITRK